MSEVVVTNRGVGGALCLPGRPALPVTVLLRHSSQEPPALRAVVVLDDEEPVDLVFDRSLVSEGITGRARDGVVQVRVENDRVALLVGGLTLTLPLADVVDLLLASYLAAPTDAAPTDAVPT